MKALLSTAASRAWMGVAAIGVLVVALVLALQLIPRLSAGQELLDAAEPALAGDAVAAEVAATEHLARYVTLVDPLVTRPAAASETRTLVRMVARASGVSNARARALLRREAPRTEALLRALPLSAAADERRRLTLALSTTLNTTPEDLQDELARGFPRLYATLAELSIVTSGWNDVPGVEGMTRFDGTPVRTMRGVRDYLREDLVATAAAERERFEALAGWGGIGYMGWLLALVGVGLAVFGVLHARWSAQHPSGRLAWRAVAAIGVLVMLVAGALQYVPRLIGAGRTVQAFEPAFAEPRVSGLRAGTDFAVQAARFGDPIMTAEGGAAGELPRLLAFVGGQAGLSEEQVRRRLERAAPRTMALLEAIPLSAVAQEAPHLLAVLSRKLGVGGDRLVRRLRRRVPGLARALLAVGPVTADWNAIPGRRELERFDGLSAVRTTPQFADYLAGDVAALFERRRPQFDELAHTWPPVAVLGWLVLGIGALVAIYGAAMSFLIAPKAR